LPMTGRHRHRGGSRSAGRPLSHANGRNTRDWTSASVSILGKRPLAILYIDSNKGANSSSLPSVLVATGHTEIGDRCLAAAGAKSVS
jgi:hypothetical protein